ncbi:hypothetical protein BYT27DRAFT_7261940 [Phlegmacium glaucopus]|nr:hypothetical protein BYT27DRAFT_7261940 [Phlegmacium glaucopus]
MVPGMDMSSVAYRKAISIFAKQQDSGHAFVPCPKLNSNGQVNTSHPSGPISGPNLDLMQCSHTILSDPIMSELINEDPKSPEVLKESLRTQIVVACQHLRIHLSIIDCLMSLYITSSEETPTPD